MGQATHYLTASTVTHLSRYLLLLGVCLIAYGYWLLAVPPDALYHQMLARARDGVFSVMGGSGLLMVWLVKR